MTSRNLLAALLAQDSATHSPRQNATAEMLAEALMGKPSKHQIGIDTLAQVFAEESIGKPSVADNAFLEALSGQSLASSPKVSTLAAALAGGSRGASDPFENAITRALSDQRSKSRVSMSGPAGYGGLGLLGGLLIGAELVRRQETQKAVRRVFFSFHYQRDIWRVQQVRNHWLTKPNRAAAGYFDGSLSEKAKTEGKIAVKRLINKGLGGASVTCVLIGAETFNRHWVDYEIFRSVELGKGVFGVRIHKLKNRDRCIDRSGPNPFRYLGYGTGRDGKFLPYAKYKAGWKIYRDADSILPSAAKYLPTRTQPVLSDIFRVYDWVADNGYQNFSSWVDAAALQAGR